MAGLLSKITKDLNFALKSKNETVVRALRFVISKIHNAKIAKGEELTDEEVVTEIAKEVKHHKESIEAFEKAQRSDLVEKEKAELEVLAGYLPEQLGDLQIRKIVEEAIGELRAGTPAEAGKVMAAVMAKVRGQAEGAVVLGIVKEKLSNKHQ